MSQYRGYVIHFPETGGKAGKGNNKTSSVMILKNSLVKKTIRYVVAKKGAKQAAFAAAYRWIEEQHA